IVGADGLNSIVRRAYEGDFGMSLRYLDNKFAWYGTTRRFDALTLTFVRTKEGTFTAHHYRYSPQMSTFIVECDRPTWERGELARALAHYQDTRRPILDKLVTAAAASAHWHEHFPEHMALPPREFAMSYITRSGRVDPARLREMSPRFMAWYESG